MEKGILFRAKKKDGHKWIAGILMPDREKNRYYITNADSFVFDGIKVATIKDEVEPQTVSECTYLTDSTGRKIFESDVVKCYPLAARPVVAYVFYQYGGYCFRNVKNPYQLIDLLTVIGRNKKIDVIGNIHDNPELLK